MARFQAGGIREVDCEVRGIEEVCPFSAPSACSHFNETKCEAQAKEEHHSSTEQI